MWRPRACAAISGEEKLRDERHLAAGSHRLDRRGWKGLTSVAAAHEAVNITISARSARSVLRA